MLNNENLAPSATLETMPDEVLSKILSDADSVRPISKRLLSFTQKSLYRDITITTYDSLDQLCASLRPRIRRTSAYSQLQGVLLQPLATRALRLKFAGTEGNMFHDPGRPSDSRVEELFAALENVTFLDISGSPRLAKVVLSDSVTSGHLKKLWELNLSNSAECGKSPWDFRAYQHLANLPSLSSLLITSDAPSIPRSEPTLSLETNDSIRMLSLRGPISDSHAGAKDLVASFTGLEILRLSDSSKSQNLSPVLLASTPYLVLLKLFQLQDKPDHCAPVDDALLRFEELEELTIYEGAFTNKIFDQYLRDPLPLTSLSIGPGADDLGCQLSAEQLMALVSAGPAKLSALEYLNLDCLDLHAKMGEKMEDHDDSPYWGRDWDEEMQLWPGWVPAGFTDVFSAKDAAKLVEIAEEAGVVVGGAVLKAIEVEEAFNEELDGLIAWREFSEAIGSGYVRGNWTLV